MCSLLLEKKNLILSLLPNIKQQKISVNISLIMIQQNDGIILRLLQAMVWTHLHIIFV